MKRFLAMILTAAMLLAMIIIPAAATEIDGHKVEYTDKAITLDGIIDDAYTASEKIELDGGHYAYLTFDEYNLYIIVHANDTTDNGSADKIQFVIDWYQNQAAYEKDGYSAYKSKNTSLTIPRLGSYEISRKLDGITNAWMFNTNGPSFSRAVAEDSNGGYNLEFRVAWQGEVCSKVYSGREVTMGFGFTVTDNGTAKSTYSGTKNQFDAGLYPTIVLDTAKTKNIAPYSSEALTVDGEIDDIYLAGTRMPIDTVYSGVTGEGTLGNSGAYFAFTDDHFYMLIDVVDTTVFEDYGKINQNSNHSEGAEIYMDWFRGVATGEETVDDTTSYRTNGIGIDNGGFMRSCYYYDSEAGKYIVKNWDAARMFSAQGENPAAAAPECATFIVKDENDNVTGYRLEYRLTWSSAMKNKLASLATNEGCVVGASIRLRDDTDGNSSRDSIFQSGNCDATNYNAIGNNIYLCKEYGDITAANITLGSDITVNYYATVADGVATPSMKFTMNNKITVVEGVATENAGEYKFAFKGLAPQCMGDNIKAELIVNDVVVDTVAEYSVLANVKSDDVYTEENKALVDALLIYGAAAQKYTNYKADALVANLDNFELGTIVDYAKSAYGELEAAKFYSAGVHYANVNKIFVKIASNDISKVKSLTVSVGDSDPVDLEFTEVSDGIYIAYTDAIKATGFNDIYTFVITDTEDQTRWLSYSVNAYAKAMQENSKNPNTVTLVEALYNYGREASKLVK